MIMKLCLRVIGLIIGFNSLIIAEDAVINSPAINQASPKNTANISFNFENVSLDVFLKEVEKIFQVSFIYDAQVKASSENIAGGTSSNKEREAAESKITFRTNRPFTKEQAWSVVDAFLDVSGLARVAVAESGQIFRITKTDIARKEAVPSFIGIAPEKLPDSGLIRYVYFLKNSSAEQMRSTIDPLKSKNAILSIYQDLNAIIFTDHSYNIKMLMKIVKELDASCTPVGLSVIKLKEADAVEVAQLYEDLKKGSSQNSGYGFGSPPKSGSQHLLQESNIFAEPRTNTLILIGPPEANARIEQFIVDHIDTKLAKNRSNLHVIELNYIPAEQAATIFNDLAKFGESSEAAKFGGNRGGEKYFNRMFFEAEKQTNSLLVRGEEEDFLAIKEIIKGMDKPQPQVAIEVLILSLNNTNNNQLGSQIHNPKFSHVNFQTSGFGGSGANTGDGSGIVTSTTVPNQPGLNSSLVNTLIGIATSATPGSMVISLGKQDVWALLSVLNDNVKVNVLANPFLIATNKYTATAFSGQERRITTETIVGSSSGNVNGITPVSADLKVKVTPRINALGIINMDMEILLEQFTDPTDQADGNKDVKLVKTNANVMDGEVIATGGLVINTDVNSEDGVPVLRKIPIIGNFFKNKSQINQKQHLIIFITPKIIRNEESVKVYTQNKMGYATDLMSQIDKQNSYSIRDPIARWVFTDTSKTSRQIINDFGEYGTVLAKPNSNAITKAVQDQLQVVE